MIFLLVSILIFIVGIILFNSSDGCDDTFYITGMTGIVLGSILAGGLLIGIPIERYNTVTYPEQARAAQITLNSARESGMKGYEGATITHKVMEINMDIAAAQRNNTLWLWDWWIHDAVDHAEFVE